MKHKLKRLTALLLALSMTLSLLSATAWAAETDEDGTVTTGDSDLELEGTDDVGNLIAGALSETEEEQTAEENYICDVEVDGTTATVTYNISEASVDADVVVAIYDEDTEQMLASGTTAVSSDDSSCTVTIEGDMPDYFLVTAYLLEADTHQPLSEEFTSQLYTQEMQEFLAKTTDDFDEELVLNLDDDTTTNFLVYSEDTAVVDEATNAATVTDNGDGTYTVTNADETFTGLQAGDTFSYAYEDGTVLIVKVKSAVVDGDTVTITEDEDADLSDVFDYVKIETDNSNATQTMDTSGMDEGVTYLGDQVSAAAFDAKTSYSAGVSFSVDKTLAGDEDTAYQVKITGSVAYDYTLSAKLYIASSSRYVSVEIEYTLSGDVSLSGKLEYVSLELGELDIGLMPGVYASLTLSFEVTVTASLSFDFSITATLGAYYNSKESGGLHSLCSKPTTSYQTTFDGTLYVGLKLDGSLVIVSKKICRVSLGGEAGVEISCTENVQTLSSSSDSSIHTCVECFDGKVTAKFEITAGVKLLNGKIDLTATIWSYSKKLYDFYASIDYDEWGSGTCPHISYLCAVTVTDSTLASNPISGATISCHSLAEAAVTDESGVATFYLPNGSYTLTVSAGEVQTTQSITIASKAKNVRVRLDISTEEEEGGGSSGSGGDTSEDEGGDTSEDEGGDTSGDEGGDTSGEDEGDGSDTEAETVASGTCGDNLTWVLDSNGKLTISGTGDMTSWSSSSSVPWYSYRTSITSVAIGSGVTSIGTYAFYDCTSLTSVTIPDSVTSIGGSAFYNCTSLTSVTIPDSVTTIGSYVFNGCKGLTSVAIPDSVTTIGYGMFYKCTYLTNVTISNSLTSISTQMFYFCENLTSVTIPDSVTKIDSYAFYYCKSLTSLNIPDSVTSIGDYAFYYCKSLTSLNIPDGVTSIGGSAFRDCASLTSITIPDSITEISTYTFSGCTGLTSITIPDSVTTIGSIAFSGCAGLTSISIPDSVTSIGSYAFSSCTSLTSVTIPDSVTSIGGYMFRNCTSLTSVTIPDSVTSIGNYAFYNCTSLTNVYYAGSEDDWAAITIGSNNTYLTNATIHYNYTVSTASITETTAPTGDLSLDYLLSGVGTVVPLMAYTGSTTSADNAQTATFTGLVSGEAYVLLVVKDAEAESLLAADNLLYIAQADADDSGSVTFTYIPRETVDSATSYAYGTSSQNLADATVTLEADSFAYTGGAIKPLANVVYNGVTLEEDVDYTMSYSDNTTVGTATATIKGRGDYAGTVSTTFTIIQGAQTVTASVDSSSILVGETAQITASAQGALSYESSDTAVATVDENGLVTGVAVGTATITITAEETDSYAAASTTLTVQVLLAPPTLSNISNTTSGVKVTWESVTGAEKYRVFRKVSGGSWAKVGDTTSTSYTDTTASSGTTYYYTVRCLNAAATAYTSSYSSTGLSIKYLTAGTISSLTNTTTGVTVKWSKVTGASGYYVYRKTSSGSYSRIATVTSGSTVSYADTAVTSGTTYTYAVRPYSGSTLGSYTGKSIKYLTAGKISSLTNTSSGITVKWSKVTGASGYYVYRKTSSGSYSKIATVTSGSTVSYSDTAVKSKNGTTYIYAVRPYSGNYTGSYTGKSTVRLTGVSISSLKNSSSKKMTVKWGKNSKATGYQIQYSTSSSFSSYKTVTVSSYKTVSKTISSLTKGKKYYVRVRAYKTVSGTKYYSAWSATKNVKISK